jgi:hypothetical protein
MRLGLLGPAQGQEPALGKAVRFLARELRVDRAVYLGIDRALDRVIETYAAELVGPNAGEAALFRRATERCLSATAEEIDGFVKNEREREGLKVFESLPGAGTRAIEILSGKVVVMIYDKGMLDEEDILPAALLVFGRSKEALVKRVGRRWFISPGSFGQSGLMVVDDEDDSIVLTEYDSDCKKRRSERLSNERGPKLRVQGG